MGSKKNSPKLKDLKVDFIGGQEPLTQEEILSISAFIKQSKASQQTKQLKLRKKQQSKLLSA